MEVGLGGRTGGELLEEGEEFWGWGWHCYRAGCIYNVIVSYWELTG